MRVVKALVAFMGVLIVVGIGLVGYGLSLDKNAEAPETASTPASPSVPVAGSGTVTGAGGTKSALTEFGDIVVALKADEKLVGYTLDGELATLHIEGANGQGARLVVVSLADKAVLGRVLLTPTAQ